MAAGIKVGGGRFGGPQNVTVFDQDVDGLGDGPFTPTVVQMDPATGLPISPRPQGAQPTTSSQSVSPATDSAPFPVRQDGFSPGGMAGYTLAAVGVFFAVDMTGYNSLSLMWTTTTASAQVAYEVSNDGVNWRSKAGREASNVSAAVSSDTMPQPTLTREFYVPEKWFRCRQVTYGGTGSNTVVVFLKQTAIPPSDVFVSGGGIGINNLVATAAGGGVSFTSRIAVSAASTNATLVKAGAGRVYKIVGFNASASIKYIKFYNVATTPVPGTTPVIFTRPLPSGGASFDWADIGYGFTTGIAYAITGGASDADTTAIAAGDIVSLNVDYA